MSIDDIKFEESNIVLPAEKTKADYERTIPFDDVVKEILEGLVKRSRENNRNHVFCTSTGNVQTPDNLNRRFRNLLKSLEKEGLIKDQEKINIHVLRKTYISHKIMAGEEPVKVMSVVGHQDWSTIKRYLSLSKEYISDGKDLPY